MKCSKCGVQVLDGDKFCGKCGAEVSEGSDSSVENYNETIKNDQNNKNIGKFHNSIKGKSIKERLNEFENKKEITKFYLTDEEIKEKKAKLKKKIKKITKIIVVIIALFILFLIIGNMLKPDLSKEDKKSKFQINGITYEMSTSWKKDEKISDNAHHRYIKKDEGEIIAFVDIAYTGENDLISGDTKYTHTDNLLDDKDNILPGCEATHDVLFADTSAFEVTVYTIPGTVKGEEKFLSQTIESFNIDDYKNPRKSLGIDVKYDGSTKAGTIIDSECDDITVVETVETILGKGTKELEWEIEKPVKLAAGKTSSVVLNIDSKEKIMKITCTDMTKEQYKAKCVNKNYKNQLREASYGKYIKIYGQVLQDCGYGRYRISSSGGYDNVYMVYAPDSDIVEDDWVTVYGETNGIYEYETVLGASQKVPEISAKYVER